MPRQGNGQYISLKSIAGAAKMCCFSSREFRDRVMITAHQLGLTLQEFVLHAVREKMQGHHVHSLEQRRIIALQALFNSKRPADELAQHMVEQCLERFLPPPN